ncbi:MAG: mercury methylation corrinoid protein HgcA [Thermoanaerobaculia bacterium]
MNARTIPTVSARLGVGDRLGRWRVRWGLGRKRYRVEPGLYRVGSPDQESPVLVTANYKLSFDSLRAGLEGLEAWILVLDTKGVNVWCAAGKGSFGTDELVRRVQSTGLAEVVSHRKLIVPQLGATGVAADAVRRGSGFRVVWGPVRARDLGAFLDSGMRATDDMRRVTFTLGERAELVGVEVATVLKWVVPIALLLSVLLGGGSIFERLGTVVQKGTPVLAGLLTGTVLVPLLLPWIPGRAFSLKGALLGAVVVGVTVFFMPDAYTTAGKFQVFVLGTVAASFFAMQFTGATTFTSPSGVEWEMRRALPFHVGALGIALGIGIVSLFVG